MPDDLLPLTGFQHRFAELFVTYRDLDKVATALRIKRPLARAIYKNLKVRAVIDEGLERVDKEIAIQIAKARILCEEKLDGTLVALLGDDTRDEVRVRAVELGYKKMGLLTDKVQHSGEGGGPMVFTLEHIRPKQK